MRFLILTTVAAFQLTAQTGQQIFESTCAGCHGLDGRGGEHAPNIAGTAAVQNLSDAGLAQIVRKGIPGSGMPAFGSTIKPDGINAVVSYLRTLQRVPGPETIFGNREAGRALFFGKAQCAGCHTMEGQGGFLASDLSTYGKTHSTDEIQRQIIGHRETEHRQWKKIVARNGKEYSGIVRNEDNFSLQLQTADGDFLFWRKADLATVTNQDSSRLSGQELNDLLVYLSQTSVAAPETPPK